MYTAQQKLKEIERELYWRNRVYPRQIEKNQMTKKMADKQIGILEEIAADYRREVDAMKLPLVS